MGILKRSKISIDKRIHIKVYKICFRQTFALSLNYFEDLLSMSALSLLVEHGHPTSKELLERAKGIRERWIDYWETTTGHRASMTADPQ
ncbi:MAG: hypothetical protein DMG78_10910 [Acidobacteria bacterium]|nr:MAG: hypothetical protein DMG78_10910 [Acidobacteriota bacterium]